MIRLFLPILLFYSIISFSQPTIEWQKSLGGSLDDYAYSINETTGGGYIVAGKSWSNDGDVTGNHGNEDFWVVKMTESGNIEWQRSLGGSNRDVAIDIRPTVDGGYIVVGSSNSIDGDVTGNHGGYDIWVVKLTSDGTVEWEKTLGGSGHEDAFSIQQTTDGGYILVGLSNSIDGDVSGNHGDADYWVVKLFNTGVIEWQKSLGGSAFEAGNFIYQTVEGGYIICGTSASNDGDVTGNHGEFDYWIVKLSSIGMIEWQNSFGGSLYDSPTSIHQTSEGGYIVGGFSMSTDGDVLNNHGGFDFWAVKLSSMGVMEWQNSLGGSQNDYSGYMFQNIDGSYFMGGHTRSIDGDVTDNHGDYDYWVVNLSNAGTLDWQKSYGGSNGDFGHFGQQTTDGGYIIAGVSTSNDGDVTGNQGEHDYWVVKLAPVLDVHENDLNNSVMLFPNPNSGKFSLSFSEEIKVTSIKVVDVLGQLIYSETNIPSEYIEINHNFPAGVYFVNVSSKNSEAILKMLVE